MDKKITIWLRGIKEPEMPWFFVHNHIEDGWVEGNVPKPLNRDFKQQKNWTPKNGRWIKKFGHLINGKVVIAHAENAIYIDDIKGGK